VVVIKVIRHPLERNSFIISKGPDFLVDDWIDMKSWFIEYADNNYHLDGGILYFDDDTVSFMFALKYL
jgi:hypothetical protein